MFVIDTEEAFAMPNTAIRIEVTAVRKRPGPKHPAPELSNEVIQHALEKALEQISCQKSQGFKNAP